MFHLSDPGKGSNPNAGYDRVRVVAIGLYVKPDGTGMYVPVVELSLRSVGVTRDGKRAPVKAEFEHHGIPCVYVAYLPELPGLLRTYYPAAVMPGESPDRTVVAVRQVLLGSWLMSEPWN